MLAYLPRLEKRDLRSTKPEAVPDRLGALRARGCAVLR